MCKELEEKGYKLTSGLEYLGGELYGIGGIKIFIKSKEELSIETRCECDKYIRKIITAMQMNIVKEDPELPAVKARLLDQFKKVFKDAGLTPVFAEEVQNQYLGECAQGLKEPWFVITSEIGHITIGWRKRVINIKWSECLIKSGVDIFKHEDVTVGQNYIHAWSYADATRYLKTLKENLNE